jgi:hypothetical protein
MFGRNAGWGGESLLADSLLQYLLFFVDIFVPKAARSLSETEITTV